MARIYGPCREAVWPLPLKKLDMLVMALFTALAGSYLAPSLPTITLPIGVGIAVVAPLLDSSYSLFISN